MIPEFRIFNRFPGFTDELIKSESPVSKDYAGGKNDSVSVNIIEGEDKYIIEVATPGLDKKDIIIDLDNDTLSISSKTPGNKKETKERYIRREFSVDSFCRSFTLPEDADVNKITANQKDGVLYVDIPKKEEAKPQPPKSISIS